MSRPSKSPTVVGHLFIVLSGLPGSGKSALARRLAPLLNLPVIDKDDILERLFQAKGTGNAARRRELSRESDDLFRAEASKVSGAILVSFWHLPGMADDSGTPTEWLRRLPGTVVNVHCVCEPTIAAERFFARKRHPGHGDGAKSKQQILDSIMALAHLEFPEIGRRIEVQTSFKEGDVDGVVRHLLASVSIG